jgi:hypothetical protein
MSEISYITAVDLLNDEDRVDKIRTLGSWHPCGKLIIPYIDILHWICKEYEVCELDLSFGFNHSYGLRSRGEIIEDWVEYPFSYPFSYHRICDDTKKNKVTRLVIIGEDMSFLEYLLTLFTQVHTLIFRIPGDQRQLLVKTSLCVENLEKVLQTNYNIRRVRYDSDRSVRHLYVPSGTSSGDLYIERNVRIYEHKKKCILTLLGIVSFRRLPKLFDRNLLNIIAKMACQVSIKGVPLV